MLKAKYLVNEDYITLCQWWTDNRFPVLNFDDLPTVNNVLQGVMIYNDDVELCAGFIIDTTVKNGAMIEYIVSNFEVKDRPLRKESQELLIKNLSEIAKTMGKKYLFTSVKNPSLISKFTECGFKSTSQGTTEMMLIL
jgi:hypothetical protein